MILEKLAIEENYLKRLAKISNRSIANFDDRVREIKKVILSMQYWDVDWASNLHMSDTNLCVRCCENVETA